MALEGLIKVDGRNFEDITAFLDKLLIPYQIAQGPKQGDRYFRDSLIEASDECRAAFVALASERFDITHSKFNTCYCYTTYRIGKDFDFTSFDGPIIFKKGGFLVERVGIKFKEFRFI